LVRGVLEIFELRIVFAPDRKEVKGVEKIL
jgi:hypothetical protein